MHPLTRCVSCLALLALAACGGKPAPAPIPTAAPAAQPAALTEADVAAAVNAALEGDFDARYFDATVDLNGDGREEVLAYVAGPMVCGTGGCPLFVFTRDDGAYKPVARISIVQVPVRVSTQSTQGWRDLVVGVAGGGIPAGNAVLKFDGTTYPSNPTVPPAEPTGSLEGAEVLIGEFGSYTDGKPLQAGPVTARVLGNDVRTRDADELRYLVLTPLVDRYASGKGIEVTLVETEAYVRSMQAFLEKEGVAQGEESPEDVAARREIGAAFIRQWKVNQALYQQYGGRIVFQQGGPEPLDAYAKFLEEAQARGDFEILDRGLEDAFWKYYRDDSIHSFFEPGSKEEAQAFASPPWEREAD
jgi:hypothetical protein